MCVSSSVESPVRWVGVPEAVVGVFADAAEAAGVPAAVAVFGVLVAAVFGRSAAAGAPAVVAVFVVPVLTGSVPSRSAKRA
ncbi:MAG TPA: hypothetical protein VGP91_14385, partial [Actinoplanes sp.]|nr:hypothetical protein [Actinoplanes sp.]